jgi:hypothetical protein
MGLIKGGIVTIISFLLLCSFFFLNTSLTLTRSLEYDVVHGEIAKTVNDLIVSSSLQDKFLSFKQGTDSFCLNNSEYVFSSVGHAFVINCSLLDSSFEEIIDSNVERMTQDIYYKEYDCGFFDCISKTHSPEFLVSKHTRDYWNSKFYLALVLSLILIGVLLFFVENRYNLPIWSGIVLIISSLPFMKIDWFIGLFSKLPILDFMNVFISQGYSVFLTMFPIGIALIVLGVILRIKGFATGETKMVSEKDLKDFVRKEIKKK